MEKPLPPSPYLGENPQHKMKRTAVPSVAIFSPATRSAAIWTPANALTTTLFVNNLHCASCVTHVKDTLQPLQGIYNVDVNLLSHTICVQHRPGLTGSIADALIDRAFEASHVTTSDSSGSVISEYDVSHTVNQMRGQGKFLRFRSPAQKKHIANCTACQLEAKQTNLVSRTWVSLTRKRKRALIDPEAAADATAVTAASADDIANAPGRFVATVTIEGMTCPTCSNTIASHVEQLDFVDKVDVDLLNNCATVIFNGMQSDSGKVVEAIDDCGFEASLEKVEPVLQKEACKAIYTIDGMTCGSCVANVTRGLQEIEGVTSVNVSLQGHRAVVEMSSESISAQVLAAIEDLGFEGSVVEVKQINAPSSTETQYRTVDFEIHGMYCPKCPSNVVSKIKNDSAFKDVDVLSEPSMKVPRITLRYKPQLPGLSIRLLKHAIEQADPSITATVYHAPTLEERSREVQDKEWRRILYRMLFTLTAAVPSFVIGVLFMSLMPESNPTRQWFERPIWAGNAMRLDWAMFITSTAVMVYGADIFHRRAAKEIWSLWRPKSKVPLLRRFYRFGSMNLLISAGTAVAYFSSLAVLIMEATTKQLDDQPTMKSRRSTTYFDTVTFLTLFILAGKFLQAHSKAKTGEAVAELGKLRPSTAQLVVPVGPGDNDKLELKGLPTDLLEIGDVVFIRHGESPPTDGVIEQEGTFLFDESSLTGESKPVKKVYGDTILTGSVNRGDPVRITVTELGGKSMLDQIIAVVRGGQSKRAPVERFADMATSYFTPVITLIAILTWVIWLVLGVTGALPASWLDVPRGGWSFWSVEFAIAVFVVACPCGLGLAAPTALFVGGGLAARAGILVQGGGEAFQEASALDAIVFDKTGTLTEGQMRVTNCDILDAQNTTVNPLLFYHIAKSLEDASTHPIAKAIGTFCEEQISSAKDGLSITAVDVQEVPGHGMQGVFDVTFKDSNRVVRYEAALGNERQLASLEKENIASDSSAPLKRRSVMVAALDGRLATSLASFQEAGCSTAILSLRKVSSSNESEDKDVVTPSAVFAITDPIRAEAPSVLRALRLQKVDVHMCTGDNETTARAIASQLNIPTTNVRAGVLPQGKADYIASLQQPETESRRRIVAFVGDGTNDAPALTAADVSIALSSGSDIAAKSASFILLNSNLETILKLVRLARRVFNRVKLNFGWAAVYNVALIPVAAGVFFPIAQWRLSPAWAALAMALSSVSVVLSSLALKLPEVRFGRFKNEQAGQGLNEK